MLNLVGDESVYSEAWEVVRTLQVVLQGSFACSRSMRLLFNPLCPGLEPYLWASSGTMAGAEYSDFHWKLKKHSSDVSSGENMYIEHMEI